MLKLGTILLTPAWLIIGGWAFLLAAIAYGLGVLLERRAENSALID
jgi:hypothetical protein